MSRMPNFYKPPLGLPFYWRDEISGELSGAMETYLEHSLDGKSINQLEIDLLRDYFTHYINAPCWSEFDEGQLAKLRERVVTLATVKDLSAWIDDCMDIGMDPL